MSECGKHRYDSKKAAQTARNRVLRRRHNRPRQIRCYPCPDCNGWHLTKTPDHD